MKNNALSRLLIIFTFTSIENMGRILLSLFTCFILTLHTSAQIGEWTWVKGPDASDLTGVWGTQGVPDPANYPPGIYGPVSFTDSAGNFWIYGGNSIAGHYGAMWKYDVGTNEWAWMNGSNTPNPLPVYGTQGIFSPTTTPGTRSFGLLGWTDPDGNFWLYGGYSVFGDDADLWKYNPAINEWAWMGGSQGASAFPHYGTFQVPAPANTPGSRVEVSASWIDDLGNLWLFGGNDSKDDVWKYDVSINQWAWMGGSQGAGQNPTYGVQGVYSSTNSPGGRSAYATFTDNDGKFWLFGGGTYTFYSNYYRNDLWVYDPAINQWAWISGSQTINGPASVGNLCDSSQFFYPEARFENRCRGTDPGGNFWLYGGLNFNNDFLGDLWYYEVDSNRWTWANGDLTVNSNPVYGIQGISDPANYPGGRTGSAMWIDPSGTIWMFGGAKYSPGWGYAADLWKFIPDSACIHAQSNSAFAPSFFASDTNVCEKFCVDFIDSSGNNPTAWNWQFEGGTPSSSTDQNPVNICYQLPGIYDVTLVTTNASGNDTITLFNYITVFATPAFPIITQVGYTLTSSPANSYQWQLNAVDIPGATNQSWIVLQTGLYTVIVGDSNGCVNSASKYVLITGIDEISDASISAYPNPSSGTFVIELLNREIAGDVLIDVVNTLGQEIFSSNESWLPGTSYWKKEIELKGISSGVYFLEIKSENISLRKKIIISN